MEAANPLTAGRKVMVRIGAPGIGRTLPGRILEVCGAGIAGDLFTVEVNVGPGRRIITKVFDDALAPVEPLRVVGGGR